MTVKQLSRTEKYDFSEKKLSEGFRLDEIAPMLKMKVNSLYVLRSDIRKLQSTQMNVTDIDTVIKHISIENLKDHLKTSKNGNASYILKELTRHKKPLQSNTLKLIELIREMLRAEFQVS